MKSFTPTIVESVRKAFDNIEKNPLDNVKILAEFHKITDEVIGRLFFGEDLSKLNFEGEAIMPALGKIIDEVLVANKSPLRLLLGDALFEKTPIIQNIARKMRRFKAVCQQGINLRKAENSKKADLLSLFIERQKANPEECYEDDQIIDELITFYVAGATHISRLAAVILYNLQEHPEYLQKVVGEVEKHYVGKDVTMEVLNKMEFLQLVIKESLRYNSPGTSLFGRLATRDFMIGDVKVKEGTMVSVNFALNNFNPKNFDEPTKFNPNRWDKPEIAPLESLAYMPFSAGARQCIGQLLTQVESKIIVSEFLSRYSHKMSEGYVHKMIIRLNYEPLNEMLVDLTKKN